jgi:hypothetical protein
MQNLHDREQFLAVAARQLRHIVVDYARNKNAQKRAGRKGRFLSKQLRDWRSRRMVA